MSKTKIEWADYTINPVKGLCPMACSYCYARRMYQNPYYKSMYQNQGIRFDVNAMLEPMVIKRPSRIFVGSTMELFGDWIDQEWLSSIFYMCQKTPRHTFIFLTKQPQNLIKWSPFPDNCHIGVSVCNDKMLDIAVDKLEDIQAKVKFISFEPLLEQLTLSLDYAFYYSGTSWAIIGQCTPVKPATTPKLSWVREIVEAADKAGVPVFLKDNLEGIFSYPLPEWAEDKVMNTRLRQEFPKVK